MWIILAGYLMLNQLLLISSPMAVVQITQEKQQDKTKTGNKVDQPTPKQTSVIKESDNILGEGATNRQVDLQERSVSLLLRLSADARMFKDKLLGIETRIRVSRALWPIRAGVASSMLLEVWDTCKDMEKDNNLSVSDKKRLRELGANAIRLAEQHNISLPDAEKLFADSDQTTTTHAVNDLQSANSLRHQQKQLGIAEDLLSRRQVSQAVRIADPVLLPISGESVSFLSFLREADAGIADARFAHLITQAINDASSDANTVSALSSYILSPHMVFTAYADGSFSAGQIAAATKSPEISAELRNQFYKSAAQILIKPSLAEGNQGIITATVIKRLMPAFEKQYPVAISQLQQQLSIISAKVSDASAKQPDDILFSGLEKPGKNKGAGEANSDTDPIDQPADNEDEEALIAKKAISLAAAGDSSARKLSGDILDTSLRPIVRRYVDLLLVDHYLKAKDVVKAKDLAHSDSLNALDRVYCYTRVASLLLERKQNRLSGNSYGEQSDLVSDPRSDHNKQGKSPRIPKEPQNQNAEALELLNRASAIADQIGASDVDRVRARLMISYHFQKVEIERSWTTLLIAVGSANQLRDNDQITPRIEMRIRTKRQISYQSLVVPEMTLTPNFQSLALIDFDRAVGVAEAIAQERMRSNVLLGIGQAGLAYRPATPSINTSDKTTVEKTKEKQ